MESTRTCSVCAEIKLIKFFAIQHKKTGKRRPECRVCQYARQDRWRAANPTRQKVNMDTWINDNKARILWHRTKTRAKKIGVPFSLTVDDVAKLLNTTKVCPVLGFELHYAIGIQGGAFDSPSLDRFIPALGYTPGRISIISGRANTLKRDGTLAEFRRIVAWMERESVKFKPRVRPATMTVAKMLERRAVLQVRAAEHTREATRHNIAIAILDGWLEEAQEAEPVLMKVA